MSRTLRRENYERTSKNKPGSKVSGKGYYAQLVYEKLLHPHLKRKVLTFFIDEYGRKDYFFKETNDPAIVYFPLYHVWSEKKFYKEFYRIHGDNHSHSFGTPGKWAKTLYNRNFRKQNRNNCHKVLRNKEYDFLPFYNFARFND